MQVCTSGQQRVHACVDILHEVGDRPRYGDIGQLISLWGGDFYHSMSPHLGIKRPGAIGENTGSRVGILNNHDCPRVVIF